MISSSSKVAPRALFLFLLLNGTKVCCNSGRKNAVDNEFVASFDDPCLAIPLGNFLSWHTLYRPRISNHPVTWGKRNRNRMPILFFLLEKKKAARLLGVHGV